MTYIFYYILILSTITLRDSICIWHLAFYLAFSLTFSLSGSGGAIERERFLGAGHADIKSRDPHKEGGGRQKQYSNVCICIYIEI